MTMRTDVCDAFQALVSKLESIYGKEHSHDFKAELDKLEEEIYKQPEPVKEEPVKEEPVKEEPVKEEPVKEEPKE